MYDGNIHKEGTGKSGPHGFEETIAFEGGEPKGQWSHDNDDENE